MDRAATPEETDAHHRAAQRSGRGRSAWVFPPPPAASMSATRAGPLACRLASREELSSYAHALGKLGKGVIEITLTQDFGNIADHEYDLLDFLLTESGRPVTWLAVFDRDDQPEASQRTLTRTDPLIKRGGVPQVACRPFISEFSMRRAIAFVTFPAWKRAYNQPVEVLRQLFAEPRVPRFAGGGHQARRLGLGKGHRHRSHESRSEAIWRTATWPQHRARARQGRTPSST